MCGSDVHAASGAWGRPYAPLAVGHEIVGKIVKIAPQAKEGLKLGDLVGVGAEVDCDGTCETCELHLENNCPNFVGTYFDKYNETGVDTIGGNASHIRVNSKFAFKLADSLESKYVAPLLCGGITGFSPLLQAKVGKGTRVGVSGIGGIGHMTILFAKALGAEVTAILRNSAKESLAAELAADHYAATDDPDFEKKFSSSVDVIINTSSSFSGAAFNKTLGMIKPRGQMIFITVPPESEKIEIAPLLLFKRTTALRGSQIGSVDEIQFMLDFAAEHQIKPWVETIDISEKGLSEAWRRVEEGDVRFRFTMVNYDKCFKHYRTATRKAIQQSAYPDRLLSGLFQLQRSPRSGIQQRHIYIYIFAATFPSPMVTQFFTSTISTLGPRQPVTFVKKTTNGQTEASSAPAAADIIEAVAPEFSPGASFYVNPLLSSGHAQTAYTAINKFEAVDKVYYKRRVVSVQSDQHFYHVAGDKMPYDRWEGRSTFAIDYVVPEYDDTNDEHERFKPASQKYPLPPRTQYLDPQKEQALLDNDKPLVLALHGLAGGSFESYLRAFVHRATDKYGFDGLVLNARGCANHTITSPQLFCALWTNDLRYLVNEHILKKWPQKRIYLIGFSLGGAIISNYLGQEGADVSPNIKLAAIMGSPWDFPQASTALTDSFLGSKVYSPKMCQNLLKLLDQHYEGQLQANEIIARYKAQPDRVQLHTLRDFDDNFTSALFGFNCALEYYRHASPDQRLLNVRVPTIIVSSLDDPIVGSKSLPKAEVKLNPYTHMIMTLVGGHLGWFDYMHRRWYSDPMARVFAEFDQYSVQHVAETALPKSSHGNWAHDRLVQ